MRDDPPGYRNYWSVEYLDAFPDEAVDRFWARASAIKARYDPENVFHLNHNVPPQRAGPAGFPADDRSTSVTQLA